MRYSYNHYSINIQHITNLISIRLELLIGQRSQQHGLSNSRLFADFITPSQHLLSSLVHTLMITTENANVNFLSGAFESLEGCLNSILSLDKKKTKKTSK